MDTHWLKLSVYSGHIGGTPKMEQCTSTYLTSHTTHVDALQKLGVKEATMINNMKNINMTYAGHIMRNTSEHNDTLLRTLGGRLTGRQTRTKETETNTGQLSETELARNDTIR